MDRLDGLDDRALVLDDGRLDCMRQGSSEHRFRVSDLGETQIVRDDKHKRFGKGGEERIRVRFGAIATAIWVPASEEEAARSFAAAVDAARWASAFKRAQMLCSSMLGSSAMARRA